MLRCFSHLALPTWGVSIRMLQWLDGARWPPKYVISEKFDKLKTHAQIENIFQKLGRNDRGERDRTTMRLGNKDIF
jgi:hypothetical protein